MYLLLIALYAIGIGAVGCAIFMFMVQKDKKKALVIGIIGLLIIIGAMVSNKLRPSYEKESSILVEETAVTNEKNKDRLYACKVNDPYTMFQYFDESKEKAEEFCSRFKVGERYDIKYRFKAGTYIILEVK
ncbi:hypothetical protein E1I69_17540 [Bacillus timonensis]|uniref:Uncharacterized protein n=1 Tax=Bacillus timonensis TaxID=1033734 RepID=A0A4S3PMU6_9BACI|nr:hypothetical protein [Bacillus timonensis]THE10748.1 hypothetical protein E1I69_17540 [Bacillus timonensis]